GRTCDAYDLQALLDDLSAHLSTGPVVAAVARRVEDLELTAPADPRLALIEQLTQEDAAAELAEPCSANLFNALVDEEFRLACSRHPPLHSPHEALAVLEEEVSELREEVYRRHETRNYTAMLKELIQVAAVCRRFSANLGLLRVADQLAAVLDRPSRPVDRVTAPAPLPGARAGFLASDGV
ncbi:MAG TPA: hypothetical protein PKC49_05425, partial [Phycisphaerae bacterium]|nr:hypothetical protein [Phycisphaerae bacterium]